jgi:hypothetical protein
MRTPRNDIIPKSSRPKTTFEHKSKPEALVFNVTENQEMGEQVFVLLHNLYGDR